jgi:hypothetical protein
MNDWIVRANWSRNAFASSKRRFSSEDGLRGVIPQELFALGKLRRLKRHQRLAAVPDLLLALPLLLQVERRKLPAERGVSSPAMRGAVAKALDPARRGLRFPSRFLGRLLGGLRGCDAGVDHGLLLFLNGGELVLLRLLPGVDVGLPLFRAFLRAPADEARDGANAEPDRTDPERDRIETKAPGPAALQEAL